MRQYDRGRCYLLRLETEAGDRRCTDRGSESNVRSFSGRCAYPELLNEHQRWSCCESGTWPRSAPSSHSVSLSPSLPVRWITQIKPKNRGRARKKVKRKLKNASLKENSISFPITVARRLNSDSLEEWFTRVLWLWGGCWWKFYHSFSCLSIWIEN